LDIFDKMARKISLGTSVISKKTDEFIATTEIKINISKLEGEIEDEIFSLGELVLNHYNNNNNVSLSSVQGRCKEIQRKYQELNSMQKRYCLYKGVLSCSHCNEEMEQDSRFCPNCGNRL